MIKFKTTFLALFTTALAVSSHVAKADSVFVLHEDTFGSNGGYWTDARNVIQGMGHTVSDGTSLPVDLSPYQIVWAMKFIAGPTASEQTAMASFLTSGKAVFGAAENSSCNTCIPGQTAWNTFAQSILNSPITISGQEGNGFGTANTSDPFFFSTRPNSLPTTVVNAGATIAGAPAGNVMYSSNGPIVVAYSKSGITSGNGCLAMTSDATSYTIAGSPTTYKALTQNTISFLSQCLLCGNGVLDKGETCDDKNGTAGDGCSNFCQIEVGFECTNPVPEPSICVDIDECKLQTDNCSDNATCSNTPGSFDCKCLPGFKGDGVKCTPVAVDAGADVLGASDAALFDASLDDGGLSDSGSSLEDGSVILADASLEDGSVILSDASLEDGSIISSDAALDASLSDAQTVDGSQASSDASKTDGSGTSSDASTSASASAENFSLEGGACSTSQTPRKEGFTWIALIALAFGMRSRKKN